MISISRHHKRRMVVTALSLIASASGVAIALRQDSACLGDFGGAVAVAIAFFAYFTGLPISVKQIERPGADGQPTFDCAKPDEQIKRLRNAIAIMLESAKLESFYLTISSVSGTLVWGFGDYIARYFGATAC